MKIGWSWLRGEKKKKAETRRKGEGRISTEGKKERNMYNNLEEVVENLEFDWSRT